MKRDEITEYMARYWFGLFEKEDPENMSADKELFKEVKVGMSRLLDLLEHEGMLAPEHERVKERIDVTYCELCREWVEEPLMVCEYRGRSGAVVVGSEGWPDRKPVKSNVHRLAEAIKALQYYSKGDGASPAHLHIAEEALVKIKQEDE